MMQYRTLSVDNERELLMQCQSRGIEEVLLSNTSTNELLFRASTWECLLHLFLKLLELTCVDVLIWITAKANSKTSPNSSHELFVVESIHSLSTIPMKDRVEELVKQLQLDAEIVETLSNHSPEPEIP